MMPTVKRPLSAVYLYVSKRFAGMPTVPTLFFARAGVFCIGLSSRCCGVKFFSHTRNTSIGTIGIPANVYKSVSYIAVSIKTTIGTLTAVNFQLNSEVTHG